MLYVTYTFDSIGVPSLYVVTALQVRVRVSAFDRPGSARADARQARRTAQDFFMRTALPLYPAPGDRGHERGLLPVDPHRFQGHILSARLGEVRIQVFQGELRIRFPPFFHATRGRRTGGIDAVHCR